MGRPQRTGERKRVPASRCNHCGFLEVERAPAVERPPIVESGDEVWRQLARGDRAAVLSRLGTAGRAPTDPALATAVVETVRATVLRTREQAATSGRVAGVETYRAGEDQLARANRLAASGQSVESLRALWQAADLYSRSLATPAPPVTVPAETRPAATSDLTIASSGVPQLGPVVEGPQPPPATAAPVTPARTEPPVAATPAPTRSAPSDSEAILDTLRRYEAAYESLDVAELLKVFPSLGNDQVEQLRRTFAGMAAYEIDSSITRVTVANNGATVLARVARRMTPRVGRAVVSDVTMEFRLQRAGADWVIVSVSAR